MCQFRSILIILLFHLCIARVRDKRSLYGFARMVYALTGRNPLDYDNYGNWCGIGGKGEPVDGVDRCCRSHDRCYHNHDSYKDCQGIFFNIRSYIRRYKWSLSRSKKSIICARKNKRCKQLLCVCDRNAAQCFARNTYNPEQKKSRFG